MRNISDVDESLKVNSTIGKDDVVFYDIENEPFKIYGVKLENGRYRRMPEATAKSVSDALDFLHSQTSGGRVRFKTDSPYIAIHAEMPYIGKMPHFALTGAVGFDIYEKIDGKETYRSTLVPPFEITDGYEAVQNRRTDELREVTINFPLYSDVSKLYIGLSDKAQLLPADPYRYEKPIVYYGHSITQGGCASRPGNSYSAMISRRFDCNFVNLGFSGSGRGEQEIAEYIAGLDMQIFVYDYDHNAPSIDHLRQTHERMYKIIRQAQPDLPIIMMTCTSMPHCVDDRDGRKQVIYDTYRNAVNAGDSNVYFIDGSRIFSEYGYDATVDGAHPNELGFYAIARTVGDVIEEILEK